MMRDSTATKAALLLALQSDIRSAQLNTHDECKLFALNRLGERCLKKFKASSNEITRKRAEDKFRSVNAECMLIKEKLATNVDWKDPVFEEARLFIANVLWRVSDTPQLELDITKFLQLWRFGPGSSTGTKATHFWDKLRGKTISVYPGTQWLVKAMFSVTPRLALSLDKRVRFKEVEYSEFFTVVKDEETDRGCSKEATGPMGLQLAAHAYIALGLKKVGVHIGSSTRFSEGFERARINSIFALNTARQVTLQEVLNQMWAQRGSVDNSIATLDLSDASNRITLLLIKNLWPDVWYQLLRTIRSPSMKYRDGTVEPINMLSPMGCGFTFAVMTLTLLGLMYGVARIYGNASFMGVQSNMLGVFGDDIIIPNNLYDKAVEYLHMVGLKVNDQKSYHDCNFRESCGGDFYMGYDVTPFYIRNLDCEAHYYALLHNMQEWMDRHDIMLPNLLLCLNRFFLKTNYTFKRVPQWFEPTSGFKSPNLTSFDEFEYLKPIPNRRNVRYETEDDGTFKDLLVAAFIGGYLEVVGKGRRRKLVYTPRSNGLRWSTARTRLPGGYLTSEDPSYTGFRSKSAKLIELIFSE